MGPWMLPQTCVVTRRTDLMAAVNRYNRSGVGAVVTKEDGLDCGYGIHRWNDIEEVYNYAAFNSHVYPFVLQPFLRAYSDIRVIIAGDHCEAYSRENPDNFRMNLTAGGKSRPYTLSDDQLVLCRQIMERGRFPYAHIDILVSEDGRNYLSEIALNGGMKGARISRESLDVIKADILESLVSDSMG
jgi:ribosomal protein S6--L-glutamate ligase